MSYPGLSTPRPSPLSPNSPNGRLCVRDRDYLLDRHGVIFKVIGDVHPEFHWLGYVKYHPDERGDRRLFDRTYRQNTVVSKSFGILADRPECYVYSSVLGCVNTGLPRQDIAAHYSCRQALTAICEHPDRIAGAKAAGDLLAIIERIIQAGTADLFGVTGSFLAGCFNARSDIDLVCYGPEGYSAARELFSDPGVIRPYAGDELTQLYLRRAKYMAGGGFDTLIRQEQRKLQGLATPALYRISTRVVLHSTIDEPEQFALRITCLRSYLGAYTGAFRAGDTVYLSGQLVWL